MSALTGKQLTDIGQVMHGVAWRKNLADQLGVSTTRVYQLAGYSLVPQKTATKVLELYQAWQVSNGVTDDARIVPVADVIIKRPSDDESGLSDAQILERVNKRFGILNRITNGVINGHIRSSVVFGAPGVGKTYSVEQELEHSVVQKRLNNYTIIRGTCSAIGLYQALYATRDGGVVVLDDSDSVFGDEEAFNILKTALDSTNRRVISWFKNSSKMYDPDTIDATTIISEDDRMPKRFDYEGGVIFITNIDFREKIAAQTKMSPHFEALFSRSLYLDLTLKSKRARMLRIEDVFFKSMKTLEKLSDEQANEIFMYVKDNADRLNELSLRTVKHICNLYHLGSDWKEVVEFTKMKYPILPDVAIDVACNYE